MSDDAARPAQPYAVMLNVAGRLAVVVGSGAGAVRAAKSLVSHGADVVVIAPKVSKELLAMEGVGELSVEARAFERGDLSGALIAIAASGSEETDAVVAAEARERGVLLNVPGDAAASDFIVPSLVRRGQLQIAVTTGGGAPTVAREVRRGIAAVYGPEWDTYTRLVTDLRTLAIERTGLTDADLAPMFAYVQSSFVCARLHAGETLTPEQLYDEYVSTVRKGLAGGASE